MMAQPLSIRCRWWSAGLISAAVLIVYSASLQTPFILDDMHSIVENEHIRKLDLAAIFGLSRTRFIPYLTLALNYRIHALWVPGYHFFNIFIHIAASLAVWQLALLLFRCRSEQVHENPGCGYPHIPALFAGLLFALHPVQTQAVTYIVQRMTSLAALFYVLTVLFYGQSQRRRLRTPHTRQWQFFYTGAVLTALAAMHSKEIAFTLPAVLILFELCFGAEKGWKRWLFILPFAGIALLIPFYRITWQSFGLGELERATIEVHNISRSQYLNTQFRVIVTYLRLLILPIGQNLDYDYPLSQGFFTMQTFSSFLLLAGIGVMALFAYRYNRLITFCVFWFYITLSVESTIIPIRDVIFEHRLYLAATAFALLLPYLFWRAIHLYASRSSATEPDCIPAKDA